MKRSVLYCVSSVALFLTSTASTSSAQTVYTPYAFSTVGTSNGAAFFFDHPDDVAVDVSNNLYVAATYNYTIQKISGPDTNRSMTTLAGALNQPGDSDGMSNQARFTYPQGVAVDDSGNVFVADTGNRKIRKITSDGNVTTIADRSVMESPISIEIDKAGLLYFCNYGTNTAIKTLTQGGSVGTVISSAPGTVQYPGYIAVATNGDVFITDNLRHVVLKVTDGNPVLIAGAYNSTGAVDGVGPIARFNTPGGIAVDNAGNLFVADTGNSTIRKISQDGTNWLVRTIGGMPGVIGSANGSGANARFWHPAGIAVDTQGRLFVADYSNGRLRMGVFDGPTNEFNAWTNSVNGKWEDGLNWSVGTPSVEDVIEYITNSASKAVVIDSTTVNTALDSLKINNLFIAAPEGDINGLALFNSGLTPLQVTQNLGLDSGGALALTNGSVVIGQTLAVGYYDGGASLNALAGSRITAPITYVGFDDDGGNVAHIAGSGTLLTNTISLIVGYHSDGNTVLVEQGATVGNPAGFIGQFGDNNQLIIAGTGSAWRTSDDLTVGDGASSGNALTIGEGATTYISDTLNIGTGGDGNVVTVIDSGSILSCGGSLRMTSGGQTTLNALYIGSGATVTTPSLVVSNGNFCGLAAGTLNTSSTLINNGVLFPVGVAQELAVLHLNGGIHTFASGLEVTDHAVVTGCGVINGPVIVDIGGTIQADAGCSIIFNGPVTNRGTILPLDGTNVFFLAGLFNFGSVLTNTPAPPSPCDTLISGNIVNLADSSTYTITDGTNLTEFNWSLAGPGASGYVYSTFNTQVAFATGVTNVEQITNATAFSFTDASDNRGPFQDAEANGGVGEFVVLRNQNTKHYAVVRFDDVQDNGDLNATWWFQTKSGVTNFNCGPGTVTNSLPMSVTNLVLHASNPNDLSLSFSTQNGRAYTVQVKTNLASPWMSFSNFIGNGSPRVIVLPVDRPEGYYRIMTQ